MSAWLHIIGLGEGGVEELGPEKRAILASVQTIIGPQRFIAGLAQGDQIHIPWQSPLSAMIEQVIAQRPIPTAILASGDPNWFGIGATLSKHLAPEEFAIHPSPSAFQRAAAKMVWPLQNLASISLHGRASETLHPHILPGNRILALTSDATTLQHVAEILTDRKYGQSILSVMENLGGTKERFLTFPASEAALQQVGDFYVLAIDCVADAGAPLLPTVPGLPDNAFISDGQLTKREVRAATLAKLAPFPGALLWDVGAGCGAIGIEWMRAARAAKAICFEREGERLQIIALNRDALGTPNLEIISGNVPGSLTGQPAPDAIFLGGDISNQALFETCWQALKPGGRLVANAVTIEGEQALYTRHEIHGGEMARIDISVLGNIGHYRALTPRRAVTQWLVHKEPDA